MAQQINLHTPILLKERRYFSAQAMAVALGAFLIGLVALGAVLARQADAVQAELERSRVAMQADRARLAAALGPAAAASGVDAEAALKQELARLQADTAAAAARREALNAGLVQDGRSHSALLRLVARTLPASAWLQDIRLDGQAVALQGRTLEPAALHTWIRHLEAEPLLAQRPLAALKLQQADGPAPGAGPAASAPPGPPPTWQFTLVNGQLADDPAAKGAPR